MGHKVSPSAVFGWVGKEAVDWEEPIGDAVQQEAEQEGVEEAYLFGEPQLFLEPPQKNQYHIIIPTSISISLSKCTHIVVSHKYQQ